MPRAGSSVSAPAFIRWQAPGLLEGRRVTTHWRFTRDVARQFPSLQVNPTAAFLKDGPFYTCGGGTAAIEMTLALIDEDLGAQAALSVARELRRCVCARRATTNRRSMTRIISRARTERLAELPAWIVAHLRQDTVG